MNPAPVASFIVNAEQGVIVITHRVRRAGAMSLVVGLILGLAGIVLTAAPAAAVDDTAGLVCNNQKGRSDQDCEGDKAHGTIKATIDATGNLVFAIEATGSFVGTGWRQIYICIPGTQKTQSADCQGNTASVLDPRPQPGGAYDVTVPADNSEQAKDVTFACSDTIAATVDADALPEGDVFTWTVHVNTCGGGTDEAFGSVTRTPPPGAVTYSCAAATDITQTSATLRGSTNDADVTRAVFRFTAPADESRSFPDDVPADGFSAGVADLSANTAYTYDVEFFVGEAAEAVGRASGCSFTTNATPDTYECAAPEDVTATSATLVASTSNDEVDTVAFTLTSETGATTTIAGTERGTTNTWSAAATDLAPSTRYTYTAAFSDGTDVVGTAAGGGCAFTTSAAVLSGGQQQSPAAAAVAPAAVAPAAVAPAVRAAELPRTGVATDVFLPMGLALVLVGLTALTLGLRKEPLVVLGRPAGQHYRS